MSLISVCELNGTVSGGEGDVKIPLRNSRLVQPAGYNPTLLHYLKESIQENTSWLTSPTEKKCLSTGETLWVFILISHALPTYTC